METDTLLRERLRCGRLPLWWARAISGPDGWTGARDVLSDLGLAREPPGIQTQGVDCSVASGDIPIIAPGRGGGNPFWYGPRQRLRGLLRLAGNNKEVETLFWAKEGP